ncbi:Fc.00g063380.m01.CDS01 [Cosmosporella sp. VM-42]
MSSLELSTAPSSASIIASSTRRPTETSTSTSTPTPEPELPPTPTTTDYHEVDETYPPMTTHWKTPRSCTWTYNLDNQPSPGATGAVAWLDLEPVDGASTLSCYPEGMFYDGRTGIFSPATCPNGWTTVTVLANTNEVKEKATTTAVCCSSEYYLDGNHCKRSIPTVLAVPITYNHSASTYDVLSSSTTTLYSATIAVYTIRALFQDQDKDMLGLKDEDDIDDDEDHGSSLSLGAKIGIGIGVPIFAILVIGAIAYFFLRKNRSQLKRRAHELNVMRSRGRHDGGDEYMGHRTPRRPSHDVEPPPAYEAAAESNSVTDRESVDSSARDQEIQALRVQKAVIQRRIEELEQVDSNRSQDRSRDE